jgi:hypothetical protein
MFQGINADVDCTRLQSDQEITTPHSATQTSAEKIAIIMDVQHSMALEGQALAPNDLQWFIDEALLSSQLDV